MTRPLITLTAADLDGCRPFDVWMLSRFTHVDKGWIYTTALNTMKPVLHGEIQCDPHDYIRAWLGPMHSRITGNLTVYRSGSDGICFDDGSMNPIDMNCPPALAAAMGDGVWKRTENGWAPVE